MTTHLRRPLRRDVVSRIGPLLSQAPSHLSIVEIHLALHRLNCDSYLDRVHGLVVGECPGPNTHADSPLFPWPPSSSAGRLMSMGDLVPGEYLGGLLRRNLVDDREWCESDGEERAREIMSALFDEPADLRVVLCGWRVAAAFGAKNLEYWQPKKLECGQTAVVIPHPSGRNRVYNEEAARATTGSWLRWASLGEKQP